MKRLRILVVTVLSVVFAGARVAQAQVVGEKFKVDGLYYRVISLSPNEVSVTSQNEEYAFEDDLEKPEGVLEIPATVSYEGAIFKVTEIANRVFYNCRALTSVSIPSSVKRVGREAFMECEALASVILPKGLKTIDDGTFRYCSSLSSINIPNSVITIGNVAFDACTSLTSITIPNSVKTIGRYAFSVCYSLSSISIPASVTSIGMGAFEECSGLEFINVDFENSVYRSVDGVLFDKKQTRLINYPAMSKRSSYTIPNSVTIIEPSIFFNAIYLESVTIPNSVMEIGASAFRGCSNLKSMSIPNSVRKIGLYSFLDCKNLSSVSIPNSVMEIEDYVFSGCRSLTRISTQIENPQNIEIGFGLFESIPKSCTLQVPPGTKALYQAANEWNHFTNIEEVAKVPVLTVTPITEQILANGGSTEVQVNTNISWRATSSEDWLHLSKTEGYGNTTLTIQADVNTDSSMRNATITFTAGNLKENITVTQDAVEIILIVTPDELNFIASGEDRTLSVSSNSDWTVSNSDSWLILSETSGSKDGVLTVTATANPESSPRSAMITITARHRTKKVCVKQDAITVVTAVCPSETTIWSAEGVIYIIRGESRANLTARVYNSEGTQEAIIPLREGVNKFSIASGFYLVQVAGETYKVLVP